MDQPQTPNTPAQPSTRDPQAAKSAIADGLWEASHAAQEGPLKRRLEIAAEALDRAVDAFLLIERMLKDGDPGIGAAIDQGLIDVGAPRR